MGGGGECCHSYLRGLWSSTVRARLVTSLKHKSENSLTHRTTEPSTHKTFCCTSWRQMLNTWTTTRTSLLLRYYECQPTIPSVTLPTMQPAVLHSARNFATHPLKWTAPLRESFGNKSNNTVRHLTQIIRVSQYICNPPTSFTSHCPPTSVSSHSVKSVCL
jgi:hypothetical protein